MLLKFNKYIIIIDFDIDKFDPQISYLKSLNFMQNVLYQKNLFFWYFIKAMLMKVFRILINNLIKENFYEKKKKNFDKFFFLLP